MGVQYSLGHWAVVADQEVAQTAWNDFENQEQASQMKLAYDDASKAVRKVAKMAAMAKFGIKVTAVSDAPADFDAAPEKNSGMAARTTA